MPTSNLGLPYIAQGQAQKEVTHNEALRTLDALVQLAVMDKDLSAPPGWPQDGQRWIVGASASGAWSGHAAHIAAWQDGAWRFSVPQAGWLAFVVDESTLYFWDGSAWASIASIITALQNLALLGVGATADPANPFSAKLNNALWTAKYTGEGGDGDLRYKLNKEGAANTLSLLFQNDWSGRAEIGLTGDDDLRFKVSPDGSSWIDALRLGRADGSVTPKRTRHYESGQQSFSFLPVTYEVNGAGQVETYRCDDASGQHPRTATISSVAADTLTLTGFVAGQFYHDGMVNVSYVRIWNISKSPAQPAWLRAKPAGNQLQVIDPTSVTTWVNGETIQIGDDGTPEAADLRVITVDVSPIMVRKFGVAFRQAAVVLTAMFAAGGSAGDKFDFTPTGAIGTATGLPGGVQVAGVTPPAGTATVSCSTLSPISNSNLLKFRETIATTASNRLIRINGMFA